MSAGGSERGRKLTPGEARLWELVMGDAKPLRGRRGRSIVVERAVESEPPAPATAPAAPAPARAAPGRSGATPAAVAGEPRGGIDKRTLQRLRRGHLPIESRLDLHGLTLAEAHAALDRYLSRAQAEGRRCVLVITGKGLFDKSEGVVRPAGEVGRLRREVPRWLAEPALRNRVLASAPAQPRHGGAGALYVLLRRKR